MSNVRAKFILLSIIFLALVMVILLALNKVRQTAYASTNITGETQKVAATPGSDIKNIGLSSELDIKTAVRLLDRDNVNHNPEKALELLLVTVQSDSDKRGRAAFEIGRLYRLASTDDCHHAALEWFKKSAGWGFRKAHLEIAKSYARGLGTQKSYEAAVKHYRIAAGNGSAAGALALINLIEKGLETTKGDKVLAQKTLNEFMPLLEKSARNGNGRAARSIGRIYLAGSLVKQDLDMANNWLKAASSLNDAAAKHDLALLNLNERSHLSGPDQWIDILTQSADQGYSGAMTALARFHLKGKYGLSENGAIAWLEKGVRAGHPGAMEELANLYFAGRIVEKDIAKATEIAERGAKHRHSGSIALLENIKNTQFNQVATKE